MTLGLIRQRPGELPAEVTGFVGRQPELAGLDGLLCTVRLVTVTGPGGVGKTRVALRAAARACGQFADGVYLAELGGLHDPDLLPHTVARSLGLPEQDSRAQADAVVDYLRGRQLLLILDSCEHLIGACAALADMLLRYAPRVTMLATSRQPMNLPGEHCCPIPPLPVPEPGTGGGSDGDAVELFAQRAAAAAPGFAVTAANRDEVVRLCRRLDGIPLAIELATVRLRTLSLEQLTSRLEHRFGLLTGGRRVGLAHQQTLRATTQWSYELCSAAERLLWARLSVFAGSFDIPAAETVCAGGALAREDVLPTLIGLVDKSVVLRTDDDGARYWLLDTIREFGAERLAGAQEQDARQEAHIAYFRAMAGDFGRHAKDDDQLPRYRRLRREHANLRAALGYALDRPDRAPETARLAADLRAYWEISGLLREGRHWLTKVLLRFKDPSAERSWLLLTCGVLATFQGELGEAVADLELSTSMAREHGEITGCALGYSYLSLALTFSGRHAEAAAAGAIAETRLRAINHVSGLVSLDIHLGYLHLLALLAIREQRYERTAWLLGAADSLWGRAAGKRLGGNAILEELHQQATKEARDTLGEDRYAALFRRGADHPLELVISLAVTDADELPSAGPGHRPPPGLLTSRERQIAALVAEGMSNRDIAQRLAISKRTVDAHLEHIFGKLGISSRVQLTTWLSSAPTAS